VQAANQRIELVDDGDRQRLGEVEVELDWIVQVTRSAERRGELFNRDAVEEIFWISGLAEMRQMYFAALKTYRQHPEPFVAVQIVTETLPKILRIFNEVFQTKKAEIEAQDAATVETKSEP